MEVTQDTLEDVVIFEGIVSISRCHPSDENDICEARACDEGQEGRNRGTAFGNRGDGCDAREPGPGQFRATLQQVDDIATRKILVRSIYFQHS